VLKAKDNDLLKLFKAIKM